MATRTVTLGIALVLSTAAIAQPYIIPDGDCGAVTFHLTRGSDFPNLGETIGSDRVTHAYVYLPKPKQRIAVEPADGTRALTFTANIPDSGVVMAAVELKPTVTADETRTEHAKAFIFCGAATPALDWQRSSGLGLEIYPQGWNGPRPQLKVGDPMRFIVVDKATNKLLRDLPMELHRAGAGRIAHGVPAPSGGMNFSYPEPGRYMVVTTYRRPDPQKAEHWLVDTSTLTFDVK